MNQAMNYVKAAVFGSVGLLIALIVMSAIIHYASRLPSPVGDVIDRAGKLATPSGWN